jgi:hypothetical protein
MRLTVLASLNLIMGRLVGSWSVVLHPLFFLGIVTIDLGLYALMVYAGTLNKTLIAMMLTGLAGVLAVIAFAGSGPEAFAFGGPFRELARPVGDLAEAIIARYSGQAGPRGSLLRWDQRVLIAYIAIDLAGLMAIVGAGFVARILQARSRRGDIKPPSLPLDAGAASPL